jgi:hypothetical protein
VPERGGLDRHLGGDGAGDHPHAGGHGAAGGQPDAVQPGLCGGPQDALIALGEAPAEAARRASGRLFRALGEQAQVLAYSNVFLYCAVMALAVAPLALLFSARRAAGGH